jgi:DNA-binding GntR family transcriptional regulator
LAAVNEISGSYGFKIGANRGTLSDLQKSSFQEPAARPAQGRITVTDIAQRLRERIASHALPPGARLREWEVAAEFDVPRLSTREALDVLVHIGFGDRQPNRGIIVKRRELTEILRLFDMREVNEGLCARIAASGVPNESWQDLVELFGAPMEAIVERKDLHAYVENHEELRFRLIAAAAAPPLTELLHRLYDLTDIFVAGFCWYPTAPITD